MTCHHGTMTVWGTARPRSRATRSRQRRSRNGQVDQRAIEDIDKRALRGWSMQNCLPSPGGDGPGRAQTACRIRRRTQLHRGHPSGTRKPTGRAYRRRCPRTGRFESDGRDVARLPALVGMCRRARRKWPPRTTAAKAAAWFAKVTPSDTTRRRAALLGKVRARAGESHSAGHERFWSAKQRRRLGTVGECQRRFRHRAALYVLSLRESRTIGRRSTALAFLVATQKPDGSWPMTPGAPGVTSDFTVPIVYFGKRLGHPGSDATHQVGEAAVHPSTARANSCWTGARFALAVVPSCLQLMSVPIITPARHAGSETVQHVWRYVPAEEVFARRTSSRHYAMQIYALLN